MSYYYGRRWRKMLRPHWAGGEYQAPSGDLNMHVQHLPPIVVDAPTLNQEQVLLIAGDATASSLIRFAPILQTNGINNSLTVSVEVLDDTFCNVTLGNVVVGSGDYYAVIVPDAAAAPSAAQVQAGTDGDDQEAVWADVRSGIDNDDILMLGYNLTDATSYKCYAVHVSIDDVAGSVASSATFTTGDVTAPVLSSAEGSAGATYTAFSTATLNVTTDTNEGTLYTVVTTSATAPSYAQVAAGQDHTGSSAAFSTSQSATEYGQYEINVTGLAETTTYYGHFAQSDVAGNQSNVITTSEAFTTVSATVVAQVMADGTGTNVSFTSSTVTEDYADPDGGTNAVLVENDGTNTSMRMSFNVTFANGVNKISFSAKDIAKSTSKRYVRTRPGSVTSTDISEWNVTDGTHAGGGSNVNITDLGGGWYRFEHTIDMSGDSDLSGIMQIYPAGADNSQVIPLSAAGSEAIAIYDVVVELAEHGLTSVDATLGALQVESAITTMVDSLTAVDVTLAPLAVEAATAGQETTVLYELIQDGTTTGMSPFGVTVTPSYADSDGGSNAVLLSNNAGVTAAGIQFPVTWADGVNRITFDLKDVTKSSATRWVRVRTLNVTTVYSPSYNVTDGTGGTTDGTDLGGGWFRFTFDVDRSGDGDLTGNCYFYMSNASGAQSIPVGSAGDDEMAIYNIVVEVVA